MELGRGLGSPWVPLTIGHTIFLGELREQGFSLVELRGVIGPDGSERLAEHLVGAAEPLDLWPECLRVALVEQGLQWPHSEHHHRLVVEVGPTMKLADKAAQRASRVIS